MLYIPTKSFEKQIALIQQFSNMGHIDVIFWMFPKSKCRNICNLRLSPKDLVEGNPVTTYGDGSMANRTRRTKIDAKLIEKIIQFENDIVQHCDSIVIYEEKMMGWEACTIEHENMCLVKMMRC